MHRKSVALSDAPITSNTDVGRTHSLSYPWRLCTGKSKLVESDKRQAAYAEGLHDVPAYEHAKTCLTVS